MAKKKETRGRPTVMTEEVIRKIEEVAALDGSVEEMAYYADIHVATLYRYFEDHPDFSERIHKLRERPVLKARQRVVRGIDESFSNAMTYLERKKKREFSTRQEITGEDGVAITIQVTGESAQRYGATEANTSTSTDSNRPT